MASLYKSGGVWVVDVYRRGKFRVGKNKNIAVQIHNHVESLVESDKYGTQPPAATQAWLTNCDRKMRSKLTNMGLIEDSIQKVREIALEVADYDHDLAHSITDSVQDLITCTTRGAEPNPDTRRWLLECEPGVRKKLIELKLAPDKYVRTLSDIIDHFAGRPKRKYRTQEVHKRSVSNFLMFFDRETRLFTFTKPDAIKLKQLMLEKGRIKSHRVHGNRLATPTVARRFKHMRSMFEVALELEWIRSNPFKRIKAGKQTNPGRKKYVFPETTERILNDLPTVELRLIFALLRWGGMRMPTEPLNLKWSDIDWHRRSMNFFVPKEEHLEGREYRTCPIFSEMGVYVDQAFEMAESGAVYCCPTLRKQNNPRQWFENQLEASLKRLDIPKWPVIFNSLRASRATEVRVRHGVDDEAKWIGHGADVSMLHYVIAEANIDNSWERAVGISENRQKIEPTQVRN